MAKPYLKTLPALDLEDVLTKVDGRGWYTGQLANPCEFFIHSLKRTLALYFA
jgi:hypothetical protein